MTKVGETLNNGEVVLWTGVAEPVQTSPFSRFCRLYFVEAMWRQYKVVRKFPAVVVLLMLVVGLSAGSVFIYSQTGSLILPAVGVLFPLTLLSVVYTHLLSRISGFSRRASYRYVLTDQFLHVFESGGDEALRSIPQTELRRRVMISHEQDLNQDPVTIFFRERLGILTSLLHFLDFHGNSVWNIRDSGGLVAALDQAQDQRI